MAPQIALSNARGTTLVETLPVLIVFAVLVGGLLLATYLLFARAWIQWCAEQALYCTAVEQMSGPCRRQLESSVREFLPWGEVHSFVSQGRQPWTVEVKWRYGDFGFQTRRRLSSQSLTANGGLRW